MNPHDDPSAAALTEAVREFLERDVLPATEGRVRFHARVAINVLAMVERELVLGPGQARAHATALDRLGLSSDAELAVAIRTGALDDRLDEVTAVVRETVQAKLEVANPRHLGDGLQRLHTHLRHWLGHWPPAPGEVAVVGSPLRVGPGWDGRTRPFFGVASPEGVVLSVPPGAEPAVEALGLTRDRVLSEDGAGLSDSLTRAVGQGRGRLGRGCFRWTVGPAELDDAGDWVSKRDSRVPPWLLPFNGDVLIAWDDAGNYGAGVGRKQHDRWGHELAVVTEEALRGRGIARRLVAQAGRRVLAEGAVPTYLHDFDNAASAHVADAAGFPDRGWQFLALWQGRDS
ncbi:MAG TPA: GNAT family N-acetyltransferase [Acidimicrobiales bacterium]